MTGSSGGINASQLQMEIELALSNESESDGKVIILKLSPGTPEHTAVMKVYRSMARQNDTATPTRTARAMIRAAFAAIVATKLGGINRE